MNTEASVEADTRFTTLVQICPKKLKPALTALSWKDKKARRLSNKVWPDKVDHNIYNSTRPFPLRCNVRIRDITLGAPRPRPEHLHASANSLL